MDHHDHEALCAFDVTDGHGVGVARYVRCPGRPETAATALTIAQLLQLLMNRADRVGVRTFSAVIAADNFEALGLLRKVGRVIRLIGTGPGVAEYEVTAAGALA